MSDASGCAQPGRRRLSPKKEEALVMRTLALVPRCIRWVSKKYPGLLDEEEAETVAKIGVMEIVAKYDEERDATYDAYAKRRLMGLLMDLVRALSKTKRIERDVLRAVLREGARTPVDYDQIGDSDDTLKARGRAFAKRMAAVGYTAGAASGLRVYAEAEEGEDPLEAAEARKEYERAMEALREAFEALTPDEQFVASAVCCDGLDMTDVTKQFGVPYITVRRRSSRGLVKLEKALAKAGIKRMPPVRDVPGIAPILKSVVEAPGGEQGLTGARGAPVVDLGARRRGKK